MTALGLASKLFSVANLPVRCAEYVTYSAAFFYSLYSIHRVQFCAPRRAIMTGPPLLGTLDQTTHHPVPQAQKIVRISKIVIKLQTHDLLMVCSSRAGIFTRIRQRERSLTRLPVVVARCLYEYIVFKSFQKL